MWTSVNCKLFHRNRKWRVRLLAVIIYRLLICYAIWTLITPTAKCFFVWRVLFIPDLSDSLVHHLHTKHTDSKFHSLIFSCRLWQGGHTILTVEQMRGWKMAAISMNELTVVSPVQGEVTGSLSPVLTPKCDWRHRLSLRSHRQPRNGPAGEVSNWTDWDNEYLNNILTCGNCINYSL